VSPILFTGYSESICSFFVKDCRGKVHWAGLTAKVCCIWCLLVFYEVLKESFSKFRPVQKTLSRTSTGRSTIAFRERSQLHAKEK